MQFLSNLKEKLSKHGVKINSVKMLSNLLSFTVKSTVKNSRFHQEKQAS